MIAMSLMANQRCRRHRHERPEISRHSALLQPFVDQTAMPNLNIVWPCKSKPMLNDHEVAKAP